MSAIDENRWTETGGLERLLAAAEDVARKDHGHDGKGEYDRDCQDERCLDKCAHRLGPPRAFNATTQYHPGGFPIEHEFRKPVG
jgi:hypothetical protein